MSPESFPIRSLMTNILNVENLKYGTIGYTQTCLLRPFLCKTDMGGRGRW